MKKDTYLNGRAFLYFLMNNGAIWFFIGVFSA